MANLSDLIEIFIKELLEEANDRGIEIQRNELANYFNCAPSQINYVLTTRFTLNKGYLIESRRGGGGYIKILRMDIDKNRYVNILLEEIGDSLDRMKAVSIVELLKEKNFITDREKALMLAVLSDRNLNAPINIKDSIRANLLKSMLVALFH